MNKGDLEKLSEIINYYSSNDGQKREQSENKLKQLRKNNMGLLCLGLLELSTSQNYPEILKITTLVLLRKIIEIDSKNYWGNINQNLKETIKQKSLDILLNNSNTNNTPSYNIINKVVFVVEQLVHTVEDFDEAWPELINLTNNLIKLSMPQDINKIYGIIKTIKYCLSFLSNEILFHLFQYNQFFKKIFDSNSYKDIKILELKVISCDFYSELIRYSLNNNLCDISSSADFISTNMINTLKECVSYLKLQNNKDNKDIKSIEYLTSDMLISIEILTLPEIKGTFPNEYKELNDILNIIIKFPCDKYQKIIEQSFQRLLDIYLIDIYDFEEKEKEITIKKYLDELFNYAYNNINISYVNNNNDNNNDFTLVLDNYNDYEKIPKIYYDNLNFVFDITAQIMQENENEKYMSIIQELENILLNQQNLIYKYIGFLLLSQIIEVASNFNVIEKYIKICFDNLNNQNYQIRYAVFYSINYYILNFSQDFNDKYSSEFLQIVIKCIKDEVNIHTKCEMIYVFNCFISHIEDDNESNDINKTKEFLFNNEKINDILKFLLNEFDDYIKNKKDSEKNLIKNELLKSIIFCCQLFSDKTKPYSNEIVIYLSKYLEDIYTNKINTNLYVNLLYAISSYGIYDSQNHILQRIHLLFICLQDILKNIKNYMNQINDLHPIILNILPLINSHKPEFISVIIDDLINILNISIDVINENDINHIDDIHNFLIIINSSIEIIDNKCINYLTQIENSIEKLFNKVKSISKINSIIGDIFMNIIEILNKSGSSHKNIKNKGKYYLEIIFSIIKHEYNSSVSLSLVDNLNKIFEYIVNYLNQNELEQVFNYTISLIEFFEKKISLLIYKKKKTEAENEMETEDLSISSEEYEDNSEKEVIDMLEENIDNLEQVNENLSLIIENMLRYSSKKKIKNISECLYNKIIPSLLNSYNNTNNNNSNSNNIKIAINLIDDLIEYLDFNKFTSHILDDLINTLIKNSKYGKPEVRQASNYGLGIFIKLSEKALYDKYFLGILKSLKESCINFPLNNSMNKKIFRANGLAYENAIAAIGKAIGYKKVKEIEYVHLWIDNLPLNVDETEMEEGHIILCDFIVNNIYKKYNLGEKYLNKILKIFVDIYQRENVSNKAIDDRIKNLFCNNAELKPFIEKIYHEYNKENLINKTKIENLIK